MYGVNEVKAIIANKLFNTTFDCSLYQKKIQAKEKGEAGTKQIEINSKGETDCRNRVARR
jgi:hypothetical protein